MDVALPSWLLVPTDFSEPSASALRAALLLARQCGARVEVLHVEPLLERLGHETLQPPGEAAQPVAEFLEKAAHRELDSFVAAAEPPEGVAVRARLVHGEAAPRIVAAAGELPGCWIAMGTHGRRGLRRLLLGSVAEAVVRAAPCPVLTLRAHR